MNGLLLSVVLISLQESPVPDLVRKVDGRDIVETFRAIDALADLGPSRHPEIEKAAAALPEFYRDALLAELKASVLTPRVTFAGEQRKPVLHLIEWGRQTGFGIRNYEEGGSLGNPIEARFDSIHGLDAFARICAEAELFTRQEPPQADYVFGETRRGAVFGHRSGAVILHESGVTRRVDFAEPSPWKLRLNFETLIGPKVRTIEWSRIRIYEATGNDGVRLDPAPPVRRSIMEESVAGGRVVDGYQPKLNVDLALPNKVDQIDRLRFSATGLIALKERKIEVSGKAGRYSVEGMEIEVGPVRGDRISKILSVKLTSPDARQRKILEALALIELEYKDVRGSTSVWCGRATADGVEFEADWLFDVQQLVKGPCRCKGMCCTCMHFKEGEVEAALPKGQPDRIRILLPDGVEERTLFAEFRDIKVWRGGARAGGVAPLK